MSDENHRSGKKRTVFIGITCLLLAVLGSSIFLVAKIEGSGGNVSVDQRAATSTPGTIAPTPTATPPITPTATSPASTASPALSATPTPLFTDDFVDNSKGWATGDVSGYTRVVGNSQLLLTATNHKMLIESLPTNTVYKDFSLTITFKLLMADARDSMGVYVRGDSNLDHDYRIDIFGDNTYAITKESLDKNNATQSTLLVESTHSSQIAPLGQQNTLRIIMKGPTLVLMVNGNVLQTVEDPDYTQGQIALFVSHGVTSAGVSAAINSIQLNPPPDQLPTTQTKQGNQTAPPALQKA